MVNDHRTTLIKVVKVTYYFHNAERICVALLINNLQTQYNKGEHHAEQEMTRS